ncbi:MAG: putative rane protein [Actinomycetota bacterium]|nr:putative rane protein [Actinomycetota bacterium]
MARLFSIKPSITFKGRKFKGIRGWAGKPTHPPLTDFPIVAYILAAAFDLVSYIVWKMKGADSTVAADAFIAATWVIIPGAVLSLGAALTGFFDWWKGLDRRPNTGPIGKASHTQVWRTVNWHMTVMLTVTVIVIIDIVVRLGQYDRHYATLPTTVLSVLAGLLVVYGAGYGGSLVFDYQFNVEGLKGSTAWDESEVDQLPGKKS